MGSLLSELLSSKGKPVICNGKLLMYGRQLIFARESTNYSVEFIANSRNNRSKEKGLEINFTTGEGLTTDLTGGLDIATGTTGTDGEQKETAALTEKVLIQSLLAFDNKFAAAWNRSPESITPANIFKAVDPYTGAVVLESELYHKMMDPYEFHRTDRNYNEAAQKIRTSLLLDYINNYYDIYTYLFNRRLMATYMPSYVKGHLVAGLFQPIECSTELIRSPFIYPAVGGFRSLINGDSPAIKDGAGNIEIRLEPTDTSNRGLTLTCVSMYDFCRRFSPAAVDVEGGQLLVPKQMDKRVFMFVLMFMLSGIVNRGIDLPVPLEDMRPTRMQELRENAELRTFANNIISGYNELSTQLVVR